MDTSKNVTLTLTVIVLIAIGTYEGKPVGKRLGKRSLKGVSNEDNKGVVVDSFSGNPFKDPVVMDPRLSEVGSTGKNGFKTVSAAIHKALTPAQRLLLKDLLASFSNGKRSWPSDKNSDDLGGIHVDNNSFFGKIRYRYKKRGRERVMAFPDSKASARAAFMQARRRMGPEFNPTGW